MANLSTYYDFSSENARGDYKKDFPNAGKYGTYLINKATGVGDATVLSNITDLGLGRAAPNNLKCIWIHENNQAYIQLNARSTTNNGLSFATWVLCECGGRTWARVFDFGNGAANDNILIGVYNNAITIWVFKNGGQYNQFYDVIPNIGNKGWFHIAWTLNPNGQWKIYLNGSLYKEYNNQFYPAAIERKNMYIGKSNWNDPYFTGYIADFRIYDSVLSEGDVKNIFNPPASLVKYDTSIKWDWTYAPTLNKWYSIPFNNRIGKWSDLGIRDNTYMTISFYINITSTSPYWRNIIHISNDDVDCCNPGNRLPGIWIVPNCTGLHIRFSTPDSGNFGIDNSQAIPMNTSTYVSIVFGKGSMMTLYYNGKQVNKLIYWYKFVSASPNAIVYVGDKWYPQTGGFIIQNLSIANGDIYSINDTTSHYDTNSGKWYFPNSKNKWYTLIAGGFYTKWNLMGIKSVANMTISFLINISNTNPNWRNIIHVTNDGNNCCDKGQRSPAIWLWPNESSILIVSGTLNDGNEYFQSPGLPYNKEILVEIIWLKRNVYVYYNGVLAKQNTFSTDFIQPNSDADVLIADPWHGQGGFNIRDLYLMNGNQILSPPTSFGDFKLKGCYNDKGDRAITKYNGNVGSIQDCANIAVNQGSTVFGIQYGGQCFTSNDNPSAFKYGKTDDDKCVMNGKPMGGSWTNFVYEAPYHYDANYIMSNTELACYKDRYPDLSALNNEKLQQHWTNIGANQNRENQCPTVQKTSGMYKFKGCYNDTGNRAIPNLRGTVKTIDECRQLAYNNKEVVFGLQNKGECWTSNNESEAYKYGILYDRNKCGPLGGGWNNQVYVSSQGFPPPLPPVPELKSPEFATPSTVETFENELNKNYDNKNIFMFILLLIIIISIIFIFYRK
jgi:hypothetical protein